MERTACVDIPALPLQLLLRDHPDFREHPAVVVADDRPQGVIQWANAPARCSRILPGMTFAAARSLASDLRAAVVPPERIESAVEEIVKLLSNFSPRVEPAFDLPRRTTGPAALRQVTQPGVYWIDPKGLDTLYGSLEHWAHSIVQALTRRELMGTIVVGFHRHRTYALARTRRGAWVIPDPRTEARRIAKVPLDRLDLTAELRDRLAVLGVRTLGDLLRLPAPELRARFGIEASQLHARMSDRWAPLTPRELVDPVVTQLQFEPPDADHMRLLFALKGALHELSHTLASRGQAMSALQLMMTLDHAGTHEEWIEPAAPTLEMPMVVDLVRLRLESLTLPAPIEAVDVRLEGVRATRSQLSLFRTHARRDLDAGSRALARIKAALGDASVTRARLRAAHLPEASFTFEPTTQLRFPDPEAPPEGEAPPLVRRVLPKPIVLPPRPRHEPEAWLGRRGAIRAMHGPFRVSGGWWVRTVERDYYYAETQHGEILWLFYDRPRRGWQLQGTVD